MDGEDEWTIKTSGRERLGDMKRRVERGHVWVGKTSGQEGGQDQWIGKTSGRGRRVNREEEWTGKMSGRGKRVDRETSRQGRHSSGWGR